MQIFQKLANKNSIQRGFVPKPLTPPPCPPWDFGNISVTPFSPPLDFQPCASLIKYLYQNAGKIQKSKIS
jgi:hypothetical protein